MQKEVYEYISKKTNDPIQEWRVCAVSGEEFAIFQSDVELLSKVAPRYNDQSFSIPLPSLCPRERRRRRLAQRNERHLFKRTCDKTGKIIISMYHEDAPYVVVHHEWRWSDKWDALKYGIKIDAGSSFFDQFAQLRQQVPLLAQAIVEPENSDYINYGYKNKDCYLTFASDFNESCMHSSYLRESEYCIDCLNVR